MAYILLAFALIVCGTAAAVTSSHSNACDARQGGSCLSGSADTSSLMQMRVADVQSASEVDDSSAPCTSPCCKTWCPNNANPWSQKCMWNNCGACAECATTTRPTTTQTTTTTTTWTIPSCSSAPPSTSVTQCMGNGNFVQGSCVCDVGWKGSRCNALDLAPIPATNPGFTKDSQNYVQTWGGGWVKEGGKYRAIVGAKKSASGSPLFGMNTQLLGLESSHPGGPYTVRGPEPKSSGNSSLSWKPQGAELAPSGFRVDMKKTKDGALVFVSSGNAEHPDLAKRGFGFTLTVSRSGSIDGPWEEICVYKKGQAIDGNASWTWPSSSPKAPAVNYRADADPNNYARRWDCEMSDPTFVELADGTAIIGYRGTQCAWDYASGDKFKEVPAFLVAPHWSGPYKRMGIKILGEDADLEDMYMWRSNRGIHMLFHHMGKEYGDLYKKVRGGYAFTSDPSGLCHWEMIDDEAFPPYLALDDCSVQHLGKRQRPSFVFDAAFSKPTHLVTGVSTTLNGVEWGDGWTAVQPLKGNGFQGSGTCAAAECPSGQVGKNGRCAYCASVVGAPLKDRCDSFRTLGGVCSCTSCKDGWLGANCDLPADTFGKSCAQVEDGSGQQLVPGTRSSKVFRCGWLKSDGSKGGWFGHCVPAAALCNGVKNCGDNTDEQASACALPFDCEWPLINKNGTCRLCMDGDVHNCAPGYTEMPRGYSQCVCMKPV